MAHSAKALLAIVVAVISCLVLYLPKQQWREDMRWRLCEIPIVLQLFPSFCVMEETVMVLKPDGVAHKANMMAIIRQHGFRVVKDKQVSLTADMVDMWYADKRDRDFYPDLQRYLTRGPCYAAILKRVDGIQGLRRLVGPTDPAIARRVAPYSIRAKIGSSIQENGIHASDSAEAAKREKSILFVSF